MLCLSLSLYIYIYTYRERYVHVLCICIYIYIYIYTYMYVHRYVNMDYRSTLCNTINKQRMVLLNDWGLLRDLLIPLFGPVIICSGIGQICWTIFKIHHRAITELIIEQNIQNDSKYIMEQLHHRAITKISQGPRPRRRGARRGPGQPPQPQRAARRVAQMCLYVYIYIYIYKFDWWYLVSSDLFHYNIITCVELFLLVRCC